MGWEVHLSNKTNILIPGDQTDKSWSFGIAAVAYWFSIQPPFELVYFDIVRGIVGNGSSRFGKEHEIWQNIWLELAEHRTWWKHIGRLQRFSQYFQN